MTGTKKKDHKPKDKLIQFFMLNFGLEAKHVKLCFV